MSWLFCTGLRCCFQQNHLIMPYDRPLDIKYVFCFRISHLTGTIFTKEVKISQKNYFYGIFLYWRKQNLSRIINHFLYEPKNSNYRILLNPIGLFNLMENIEKVPVRIQYL